MITPLTFDDIIVAYVITPLIAVSFIIIVKLFAHFIKL